MCSIVLLLGLWEAKRAGALANTDKELDAVHKFMHYLSVLETRWSVAGRIWCASPSFILSRP
jgi:hypothetical protein